MCVSEICGSCIISLIILCLSIATLVEINYIYIEVKHTGKSQAHKTIIYRRTCDKNWIGLNERCYKYFNNMDTWHNSVTSCESEGSVVFLPGEDSNAFELIKIMTNYSGDIWLGASRDNFQPWKDPYGKIVTVMSEIRSVKFGCAVLKKSGIVSVNNCSAYKKYICEKPM
ncbi:SWPV2-ORF005 [Shearwaterpox virus]|uniref:SWPV2-ORF005 n=1 Tax=Shearwaterpox virus TaxID=1974596 RepID=A0A1V0QFW7_CNPV|nr:SWPV2-ORF005 [Shearwaterpox virus]QRI42725.1 C-type lectin-like protein [Cheloniid poxvirus 1]QRM15285.1 C-type lectin-like protein [Mudlarkpox virus]QRM15637.1 c-type lectin-like protein [Penguinpox virus 2]QRM15967.1 c-type lectin-like protein [Albatrosspox virus]